MPQDRLQIVSFGPELTAALSNLFAEISADGEDRFFHPHPFTRQEAQRLCNNSGRDQYYALLRADRVLGYGMLRGWEEGFEIPSLGIFIRKEARGKGLGKLMMAHLHAAALFCGAVSIRLKVHQDNQVARKMYEELAYVFRENEGTQLVGYKTISTDAE